MVYPDEQLNVPRAEPIRYPLSVPPFLVRSGEMIEIPRSEADFFGKIPVEKSSTSHVGSGILVVCNGKIMIPRYSKSILEGFEASSGYMTICSVHVGSICSLR